MKTEFVRNFKNSTYTLYNPLIKEDNLIYVDNNENGRYRYWISPITKLNDSNSIKILLPDKFVEQKYLAFYLDKIPLPASFGHLQTSFSNFINDNKYHFALLNYHPDMIVKQPFNIVNISATYQDDAYPASNMYGDNPSSYYLNNSTSNQTITFELDRLDQVLALGIYVEYDSTYTFKNISSIHISQNGSNWTSLTYETIFSYTYNYQGNIKTLRLYGQFNSTLQAKYVRITVPSGMKINKIIIHSNNNNLFFNDKFYIKPVSNVNDIFINSNTNNDITYTLILKNYPINYNPSSVLKIDENIQLTEMNNDDRLILPTLDIHTYKKQIIFNVDTYLDDKGLYVLRNSIFYPAKRKNYVTILTDNRIYPSTIHDAKEVLIPSRGKVALSTRLSYWNPTTIGLFDINTGNANSTANYWKSGLIFVNGGDIFNPNTQTNIEITQSTDFSVSYSSNPRSIASADANTGLVITNNPIQNKTIRHLFVINGEQIYPNDIIDIYQGDIVSVSNSIERLNLSDAFYYDSNWRTSIEWLQLDNIQRQYVISNPITLKNDEIPYEIITSNYEPELKVMISIDGNKFYGIDRTTNQIIRLNKSDINDLICENRAFTLQEIHRILPNINLLDSNYNNTIYFLFYLPYAKATYKSLNLYLRVLKGQYIKHIFSFDNGNTWKRYNPINQNFEDITFSNDDDAFNKATLALSIPRQLFGNNNQVLIRYLTKSNYRFDAPMIKSRTKYITSKPKEIVHYSYKNSNTPIYFESVEDYSYNSVRRDGIDLLTRDVYGKYPYERKVVFVRGNMQPNSFDLNYNLYYDTGIYNNQTINYLIHINVRDRSNLYSLSLLGFTITTKGIYHKSVFSPFDTTKDLRQIKHIKFMRNNDTVNITITWMNNTITNATIQNYIQELNIINFKWYANTNYVYYQVISDNTIYQSMFDVFNEFPSDYNYLKTIELNGYSRSYDAYILNHSLFNNNPKLIISKDDNTWYSLDKNLNPMTINNPDDVNEIKEKGMTALDYLRFGRDNWKSLFNIPSNVNSQLLYIRNTFYPLQFIVDIPHDIAEAIAVSGHSQYTINMKKFII